MTRGEANRQNRQEIDRLVRAVEQLPRKALAVAAYAAHEEIMSRTYQDTGNAAYNWRLSRNDPPGGDWLSLYGQAPVGEKGDRRGFGHPGVIMPRLQESLQTLMQVAGTDTVIIENKIDWDNYVNHYMPSESVAAAMAQAELAGASAVEALGVKRLLEQPLRSLLRSVREL